MPHTHDKAAFEACRRFLNLPKQVLRRCCTEGKIALDAPGGGQQQFQALLFDCFFSSDEDHPWDRMIGRTFRQLICYFSWVAPQPDRLLIRTNTADRIASYLLPHTRVFADGSHEHSGIAGLRVDGFGSDTIHLCHVPTGGRLDLQNTGHSASARSMRYSFQGELEFRLKSEADDGRDPVHANSSLTAAEEAASGHWAPSPSTPLRSALMARSHLWWYTLRHGAALVRPRRSNTVQCLRWDVGRSCEQIGSLLTSGPLSIPGAVFTPRSHEFDVSLLRLDAVSIELRTPLVTRGTVHPWNRLLDVERENEERRRARRPAELSPATARRDHPPS
ncbi:hypothetical protein GTY66_20580 [Streptomyces sp. SID8356]|uniref:hypothetical protein n=1 Tax=unclassified Streptomyces TaxID=2593676 RepID=UPI00037F30B2|nr:MULTISPECIES: hypothetical protein [unclassified Streptomyces]MYT38432.1 hypothetical protein [Streptomyces sp. SID8356]